MRIGLVGEFYPKVDKSGSFTTGLAYLLPRMRGIEHLRVYAPEGAKLSSLMIEDRIGIGPDLEAELPALHRQGARPDLPGSAPGRRVPLQHDLHHVRGDPGRQRDGGPVPGPGLPLHAKTGRGLRTQFPGDPGRDPAGLSAHPDRAVRGPRADEPRPPHDAGGGADALPAGGPRADVPSPRRPDLHPVPRWPHGRERPGHRSAHGRAREGQGPAPPVRVLEPSEGPGRVPEDPPTGPGRWPPGHRSGSPGA